MPHNANMVKAFQGGFKRKIENQCRCWLLSTDERWPRLDSCLHPELKRSWPASHQNAQALPTVVTAHLHKYLKSSRQNSFSESRLPPALGITGGVSLTMASEHV